MIRPLPTMLFHLTLILNKRCALEHTTPILQTYLSGVKALVLHELIS